MKKKWITLMLAATLTATAYASGIVLPDSCGDDKIKFDVDTRKDQPFPAAIADGKARIVFVDTFAKGMTTLGKVGVARLGMDGTWIGAATDNSYFIADITPGEHHLCTAMQSKFGMPKNFQKSAIGMTTFTAEAGKTYYFEFKLSQNVARVIGGGAGGPNAAVSYTTDFQRLDEDNGKFRVKASEVALFKPQK